jgi:hypothetical protein
VFLHTFLAHQIIFRAPHAPVPRLVPLINSSSFVFFRSFFSFSFLFLGLFDVLAWLLPRRTVRASLIQGLLVHVLSYCHKSAGLVVDFAEKPVLVAPENQPVCCTFSCFVFGVWVICLSSSSTF